MNTYEDLSIAQAVSIVYNELLRGGESSPKEHATRLVDKVVEEGRTNVLYFSNGRIEVGLTGFFGANNYYVTIKGIRMVNQDGWNTGTGWLLKEGKATREQNRLLLLI